MLDRCFSIGWHLRNLGNGSVSAHCLAKVVVDRSVEELSIIRMCQICSIGMNCFFKIIHGPFELDSAALLQATPQVTSSAKYVQPSHDSRARLNLIICWVPALFHGSRPWQAVRNIKQIANAPATVLERNPTLKLVFGGIESHVARTNHILHIDGFEIISIHQFIWLSVF